MADDLKIMRTEIEKLEKLNNKKTHDDIVEQLKKINKCFLTNYKLSFEYKGKAINIIPIETEIYYHNENIDKNIFEDKMIHKNELQKNNFGRLYFHRIKNKNMGWGKNQNAPIDLKSCGVDICISNSEEYYLSILIRSAFIYYGKEEEKTLYSGINNICKKIINFCKPTKCLQCFFTKLEDFDVIQKRTEYINIENIFCQQRIVSRDYSKKDQENQELNCLNLGEKDEYLDKIISTGQTFYKKYNTSEKIEEYKKSLNRI